MKEHILSWENGFHTLLANICKSLWKDLVSHKESARAYRKRHCYPSGWSGPNQGGILDSFSQIYVWSNQQFLSVLPSKYIQNLNTPQRPQCHHPNHPPSSYWNHFLHLDTPHTRSMQTFVRPVGLTRLVSEHFIPLEIIDDPQKLCYIRYIHWYLPYHDLKLKILK